MLRLIVMLMCNTNLIYIRTVVYTIDFFRVYIPFWNTYRKKILSKLAILSRCITNRLSYSFPFPFDLPFPFLSERERVHSND
jgi:hypothetical protein